LIEITQYPLTMKKSVFLLPIFVLLHFIGTSQVPQKMTYQAVIRDVANNLISNSPIGMQLSILQGSPSGTVVFSETHMPTSNANGLVSIIIGEGTLVSGSFSGIDWANGPYFIQSETDPNGGTSYSITGTSQLMSVPYALYAENSGNSIPGPSGATGPQGPPGATGPAGSTGTNGLNAMVKTSIEASGANCSTGGVKIEYGLDANSNGILDAGEVNPSLTKFVCNGAQGPAGTTGATGATGPAGATGPQGPQGATGASGAIGPQGPQGPAGTDAQTLSIVGNNLSISGGNTVTLASGGANTLDQAYDQGGAGLGRTITTDAGSVRINNAGTNTTGMEVNSSVANSTAFLANVNGSGVGFRAESTSAANTFAAIQANTNSSGTNNSAILGNNSGAGYGVSGQIPSTATGFAAVYGSNLRTSGGCGVNGIGFNGVVGQSSYGAGYGVYGNNTATTGLRIGTYGMGFNGVYGQTTDPVNGWAGYFTADIGSDGAGYALGGWINASDKRLKTNIIQVEGALSKLNKINGKRYTLNTPVATSEGGIINKERVQYGVIAQELEEVFPEMVQEKKLFINTGDNTSYKTVEYTQLIPVMIEAIKELNAEIETLKLELEKVRNNQNEH
jgi:hypothetical protein